MWVVTLKQPIPGVAPMVFLFNSETEASEFQSCVGSRHPGVDTTLERAGEPTDVFPHWGF